MLLVPIWKIVAAALWGVFHFAVFRDFILDVFSGSVRDGVGIAVFLALLWFPIFLIKMVQPANPLDEPQLENGEFFTWASRTLLREVVEFHGIDDMPAFTDTYTPPLL